MKRLIAMGGEVLAVIRLTIPGELPTMNEIIAAANTNRHVYNAMKRENDNLVAYEAISQRVPKVRGRVVIHITWHAPTRRKDPDGIQAGVKFICDGLVQAGVLQGDGWRHIAGIEHTFAVDRDNPRVVVELERVAEEVAG